MKFIAALAIGGIFLFLCDKALKKRPYIFYAVSALLTLAAALGPGSITLDWAPLIYFWQLFQRGTLAQAFFVVVMFTGTLKNSSDGMKRLMPIRGELSILASILCFGHYIYFGKTYYVFLFTDPSVIPAFAMVSIIMTLVQLVILIPLFVTSFMPVRKKMGAKRWKKLQKSAYVFYGLTWAHIVLVNLSGAISANSRCIINLIAYTAVFGTYAILRIRKAVKANEKIG